MHILKSYGESKFSFCVWIPNFEISNLFAKKQNFSQNPPI